jgi:hypothetical protein
MMVDPKCARQDERKMVRSEIRYILLNSGRHDACTLEWALGQATPLKKVPGFIPEAELLEEVLAETCGRCERRSSIAIYSALLAKLSKRLDGDPRRRIVDVLKWYRYHHNQKYVPQFTSAKAFVTKFFQLERAKDRHIKYALDQL